MMPVIRINDATFVDLKSISTWLGTRTPSETIDSLVQEKMRALDLERDVEENSDGKDQNESSIQFENAPGLTFTRILYATIGGGNPDKTNWSGLLVSMIGRVKAKGLTGSKLVSELQIPAKTTASADDGFRYYPELGISVQGQSAAEAWKEISRLASKFQIPVEVQFQWRENDKAQHPGRIGIIRAGKK